MGRLLKNVLGQQWPALHPEIRQRFTQALVRRHRAVFKGVVQVHFSFLGKILGGLYSMLTGHKLLGAGEDIPAEVRMHPSVQGQGIRWERRYRIGHLIYQMHSMKYQAGSYVAEKLDSGLCILYRVFTTGDSLHFRSARCYWAWRQFRIPLPRVLMSLNVSVEHENCAADQFCFRLTVSHPLFGRLFHQQGNFVQSAG